ncbi:DUF4440 domain-containing protein [Rhodococcus sp. 24CO]|uniref:nuclear transport factor 2 family protein n=1 Tax=Rhodococcus sp. 24CO TaxID=3117460 RepID=UPI003D33294A
MPRLKPPIALLVLTLAVTAFLAACASPTSTPDVASISTPPAPPSSAYEPEATALLTDDDVAAILQSGRDRSQAMVEKNVARLDQLLADSFTAIHIDGYEQPKAEWLARITSGDMAYHHVEEMSAAVALDGETAVLTARNLVTATINGANGTWPLESTTRYAKENGTWVATESRSSTF